MSVLQREPLAFVVEAIFAIQQADDDAECLVLAVALHHRLDAEGVRIGWQRTRPGAEHRTTTGHVIELHHALSNVERMVIRQRDDARAEADVARVFTSGGEEQLGARNRLPARRVMLATPELLEAEFIEVFHQLQIAPELKGRRLANRVVGGLENHRTASARSYPAERRCRRYQLTQ